MCYLKYNNPPPRISKQSHELLKPFIEAGYTIEDANEDPKGMTHLLQFTNFSGTAVVIFPIHIGEGVRSLSDVSMWEQLELASLLQV